MNFKLEFSWIYLIKNQLRIMLNIAKEKYVSMSLYFIHYPNLWIMLQHKKILRHISPIVIWIPNSFCQLNFDYLLKKYLTFLLLFPWNPSSHSLHPLESTQKSMKDKTKETKTKHIKHKRIQLFGNQMENHKNWQYFQCFAT